MPQMAPLPWLSLFILFILLMITSCSLNYYFFLPKIYFKNKSLIKKSANWSW